ncbi:MAG TPA: di-heme oxidoredictase family protein [Longimicrobiales bacterium]
MTTSDAGRISCVLLLAAAAACGRPEPVPPTRLGEPLPGLDARSLGRFLAGRALFDKVFSPEEGLGPLFNENQCSACHTSPATGGTGEQRVTRASRFTPPDDCDPLTAAGGENVRLRATPTLRAHGIDRQPFPAGATDTARFNVPFLFGLGLVEAIPEDRILARADPDDRDGDGISGRPGRDARGRFARFGRKADHASLRDFVQSAAHLEMGLTTPARPREGTIAGAPLPPGTDPAADPELDATAVALLTDYIRFLAPPARGQAESDVDRRRIERGAALFAAIGCADCHVPSMTTGRDPIPALDRKRVELYSDLLLHDMGPALATVCAPGASPTELRTEPLMGLGRRDVFLHDGRTRDLSEAIGLHGGEAAAARERFRALDELERHAVLRFLRSL